MKKLFLLGIVCLFLTNIQAQIFTIGPITIPSDAKDMGKVKDDTFTAFYPDYPTPNMYYHETNGMVYIYVLSLKKDKTFNGIKVIRINPANIEKGKFMAEGVDQDGMKVVNIYTRSKNVMETCSFFDFNLPAGDAVYEYALQININALDKDKALQLVDWLNAKQKKE